MTIVPFLGFFWRIHLAKGNHDKQAILFLQLLNRDARTFLTPLRPIESVFDTSCLIWCSEIYGQRRVYHQSNGAKIKEGVAADLVTEQCSSELPALLLLFKT